MAIPAALEPGSLGDLGAVPDGGEGGLDRIGRPQMHPVLGRVVVEREQLLEIVGDLRGSLGELRAIPVLEGLGRRAGVVLVFGVPDLGQRLLRARMGRLRQRGQDIGDFVKPPPLLLRLGEHLA